MRNLEGQVIAIRRIAMEIEHERVQLLGATEPLKAGTAPFAALARKIDGWERKIATMEKSVRSQEGLIEISHKATNAKSGNYDAKQSYKSKMGNMGRLRRELLGLSVKIAGLIDAAGSPVSDEVALINGLESAISAITKGGEEIVLTPQETQSVMVQVSKASGPMGPIEGYNPNMPIGLLTLALVLVATVKKVMSRKA